MPERGLKQKEHILPRELLEFLRLARSSGYASGDHAVMGLNVQGFKGYKFSCDDFPYYYQDNFIDKSVGVFGGFEMVKKQSYDGPRLFLYTYGGGLTEQGLLIGEGKVYKHLKDFLLQRAASVRLGLKVQSHAIDHGARWDYVSLGELNNWGWIDHEHISSDEGNLYKMNGVGLSFINK